MDSDKSRRRKPGIPWRFAVLLIIMIIIVIFAIQNGEETTIRFFRMEANISLALVLFIAMLTGAVITMILSIPSYFRNRKSSNN